MLKFEYSISNFFYDEIIPSLPSKRNILVVLFLIITIYTSKVNLYYFVDFIFSGFA